MATQAHTQPNVNEPSETAAADAATKAAAPRVDVTEATPIIPDFVQGYLDELNLIREERGKLFADECKPCTPYNSAHPTPVQEKLARQKKDEDYRAREQELCKLIKDNLHLLPPEMRPQGYIWL